MMCQGMPPMAKRAHRGIADLLVQSKTQILPYPKNRGLRCPGYGKFVRKNTNEEVRCICQIASVGTSEFVFVDTRSKEQYDSGHIPGAMHIKWRQILSRRDELSKDRSVVLYRDLRTADPKIDLSLLL
jgi:hypothetical protein